MKSITVGQLRQNPTAALDDVEHGAIYVVTRHRREVARLVPPVAHRAVTASDFARLLDETPLEDDWAGEIAEHRAAFDERPDPWASA